MVARSKVLHIFAHAESILTNSLYMEHTHKQRERGEREKKYENIWGTIWRTEETRNGVMSKE